MPEQGAKAVDIKTLRGASNPLFPPRGPRGDCRGNRIPQSPVVVELFIVEKKGLEGLVETATEN